MMELDEAFRYYREKIVNQWVDYLLSTYESSGFFQRERDLFANPVGGNTRQSLSKLFVLLSVNADNHEFIPPIEQIMKIRAVQKFAPSEAVGPLHGIKHIVREVFSKSKETKHLVTKLSEFDFAVDLAVLVAFDVYMQCREQLYKVRIQEIKTGSNILTDSKCPSRLLAGECK
jgi:hypothetical protein